MLPDKPIRLWLKMGITSLLTMFYLLYRGLYSGRSTDCLIDTWHDLSLPIN